MQLTLIVLAGLALQATAIYCAFRAAATARTAQGAAAWAVFLLAAPYLALPLYAFLGQHRYKGYVVSRRESARVTEGIRAHPARLACADTTRLMRRLASVADLHVVTGNSATLLVDGAQTFAAIFDAIERAERDILLQFYILRHDSMGQELARRLIAAAARGVTVRVLYDPVGSIRLSKSFRWALTEGGVQLADSGFSDRSLLRFGLNFRNHRKTIVVDGTVGFIGGLNVGDEYMGSGHPPLAPWRDTHLRLRGPLVEQLQLIFTEDWHWATGEVMRDSLLWPAVSVPGGYPGLLVPSGPADPMESGALMFVALIGAAQRRIWIASAYFVPDRDVLSALKLAALGGAEVRLLVPEAIDHYAPWLAALAYFDEARAAGIEIWRYREGFMHQKVVLIDDDVAAVGTANLDNRSFRLNFEAMAVLFDAGFAREVEEMLEADFARADRLETPLTARPLPQRAGAVAARLAAPLL